MTANTRMSGCIYSKHSFFNFKCYSILQANMDKDSAANARW